MRSLRVFDVKAESEDLCTGHVVQMKCECKAVCQMHQDHVDTTDLICALLLTDQLLFCVCVCVCKVLLVNPKGEK